MTPITNNGCLIVTGGDEETVARGDGEFVIACDRGCLYAARQGIVPDLCVGDFDSYGGELPRGVPVVRYPSEKDDTDTMIAVREAVGRGFRRIRIACAFGGRLDHSIANVQAAVFAARAGAFVTATGAGNFAASFGPGAGEVRLPRREGCSLSVFAVGGDAAGVTIKGAKYETEDATLSPFFPLGACNEWAADEATVSVGRGILLVMSSPL